MIKFVLGKRKSGKSDYLIKEINKKILKKEKVFLLVPEQSTLNIENKIIKKLGTKGIIDVQVVSFEKLTKIILKYSKIRNKKILKEQGQKMILLNILKKTKLSYFKNVIYKEIFLKKLLKTINELRENGINDLNFSFLNKKNILSIKLKEILKIKNEYCNFLKNEEYIDFIKSIYFQKDIIEKYKIFKNINFFIDEFFSFSNNQISILQSLFKSCKSVHITLPYEEINFFEHVNIIYKKLMYYAKSLKKEIIIFKCTKSYFKKPILSFLENYLIGNTEKTYKGSINGFFLKEALNSDIEVEEIFNTISKLLKEGVPFSSIKILCNNLEEYKPLIKFYKEIYNFPIFINEKIYVCNHPIIQSVILLLEISENYNSKKILNLLKTNYFDFKEEEIEILEIYIKENNIESYQWENSFHENDAEKIRLKIIKLFSFKNKLNKLNKCSEKIIFLYYQIGKFNLYKKLNDRIEYYKKIKLYKSLYIDTQIWNLLLDTLDQCIMFLGKIKCTTYELMLILKHNLMTEYLKILPTNLHEIEVLSKEDMFKESVNYLFIMGASEENFSKFSDKETLFSLSELKLIENEINWGKSFKHIKNEKILEFYFSLTASSKYLHISYSLKNNQGEDQKLEFFIKQFISRIENFQKQKLINFNDKKEIELISKKKALLDLMKNLRNKSLNNFDNFLLKYFYIENKNEKIILENHFKYLENSIKEGILSIELTKSLFFNKNIFNFSISKLEKYASCPYSFFISYALKPLKYKKYLLDNLKLGIIFHNALEIFQKKYFKKNVKNINLFQEINKSFDHIFENDKLNLKYVNQSSIYKLKKIKEIGLSKFVFLINHQKKDFFNPKYFELSFSNKNEIGAFNIKFDKDKNIDIEGKIDRIDILKYKNKCYLKIIDFKLNKQSINYSKFFNGISMQLFFYLNVLMKKNFILCKEKFYPAALLYIPINKRKNLLNLFEKSIENEEEYATGEIIDKKEIIEKMNIDHLPIYFNKNKEISKKSSILSENDFSNAIKYVDKKIIDILKNILNGIFKPNPYYYKNKKEKYCSYCEYYKLCKNKNNFNYLFQENKENIFKKIRKEL